MAPRIKGEPGTRPAVPGIVLRMGYGGIGWRAAAGASLSALLLACGGGEVREARGFEWDARAVRHLYNRAGFGATPGEIHAALARTPEAVVEELIDGGKPAEGFEVRSIAELRRDCADGSPQEYEHRLRIANQEQLRAYSLWWVDSMLSGRDPLRDRLALFWHGFFPSSVLIVRHSGMMATQHRLLRDNALGSFADLLHGIALDPAMIEYLDGAANERGAPNENLARELMELFSLGEGEFTERDVREVSRALTGLGYDPEGRVTFDLARHDDGEKSVLGVVGKHGPRDVVRILLEQDACARHVAGSLIEYLEGLPPSAARIEHYARLLRRSDYELKPLLRELLLDPDFYRAEVVGTRVQSPHDYFVGAAHRLRIRVPALSIHAATAELGHELFAPPSVEGWAEGQAWITTSALITRANYAGVLLDVVDLREVRTAIAGEQMLDVRPRHAAYCPKPPTGLRTVIAQRLDEWAAHLDQVERQPLELLSRLPAAAFDDDDVLADEILARSLAIEAPADLRASLIQRLARERRNLESRGRKWRDDPAGEEALRRSFHWVLGSPAAQLH